MKKQLIFILTIFLLSTLGAVNGYDENDDYQKNLMKFYFDKGEYSLSLLAFDAIDDVPSDSCRLMQASALIKLDQSDVAVLNLALLREDTQSDSIYIYAYKQILEVLKSYTPLEKIEFLTKVFDQMEPYNLDIELLEIVAQTYEAIELYSEANDIYNNLADSDTTLVAHFSMKIGKNLIFKKDYAAANQKFVEVLSLSDSLYIADALFFGYIAHYALGQHEPAKSNLLRLYYEYPDDNRFTEIVQQLADIFWQEGQYLVSWYWLDQLYIISDDADRILISERILKLRQQLSNLSNSGDQFKYLQPTFAPIEESDLEDINLKTIER